MPKESQFKDYFLPKTVEEALALIKSERAKIIGGGTTFFELAQRGLFADVEYIVDLKDAGLDYFVEEANLLRIGSTCTMSRLLGERRFARNDLAGISDALRCVEPLQVRNVATIGGTVCASVPFFDMPVSLCSFGCSAVIRNQTSERVVPLEELFVDNLVSGVQPDELLVELRIPTVDSLKLASSFVKHSRTGFDIGTTTCGMALGVDKLGHIRNARVFIGNIANVPFRATSLEGALLGRSISDSAILDLLDSSSAEIEPIGSLQGSVAYKKQVLKVLAKKAFQTCISRLNN